MISKKVPHTYIQDGIRYYSLICPVETSREDGSLVKAINFYMFDQYGLCWLNITHTTQSFINDLGNGLLRTRHVLEVDGTAWDTRPIVDSDAWIDGSPDRGYAAEAIREGLGLNLKYLTVLMEDKRTIE